jgi:hypothetical protein
LWLRITRKVTEFMWRFWFWRISASLVELQEIGQNATENKYERSRNLLSKLGTLNYDTIIFFLMQFRTQIIIYTTVSLHVYTMWVCSLLQSSMRCSVRHIAQM